ncbi:hypothetical protein OF829_17890 [Sphingomonas sp. LB-2]|uniref:hypothetical protein n=1 Tax=Sphingomonas caeni TaxID=2984949 RepID=UPI00222FBAE8|nr:hypothetical protein [Sphingomonas caeni]MCW3849115.1 hypothetical protein [Sphingomonas caeni]
MRLVRPWLVEGRAEIAGATDKEVLTRLAQGISDQYKVGKWHADGAITFTDYSLFAPNWPTLSMFTSGRMWIVRDARAAWLHYRLHCLPLFVFSTMAAVVVAIVGGLAGERLAGFKYGALVFALFYGMNMLITLPRVSYFFDNIARNFDPAG